MTGGHLYHQRMAELAATHGALVERITASGLHDPVREARGVVLVDSLTAWSVAPWLLRPRHRRRPIAAIVHQPPGGVDHGPVRTALQRSLDLALYRRCDLLVVTGPGFADELVDRWHFRAERIRVVEPGCDIPDAVAAPGDELDLRRGRRIALLNVANWWPNKGVLELLDAVATLPSDRVTLHLVGREDVEPRYGRQCTRAYTPLTWQGGWLCTAPWHRPGSAGSTPAPTCSCRPAPARRTGWSTARRWPPGSRSSVGVAGACRS